ncbi:Trp biosynthesis-associated membrane protein [Actinokineospora spheciospongiae]|uniref:Trp biosynthesis-associated membrane protein n=1 Tax=Actinokineospora spheciospongiae TaxID=909613 RepID=UPI0004B15D19|nr:Trp biosynthesis-associated membrane protein [Actinokineospora spheciospongiae]
MTEPQEPPGPPPRRLLWTVVGLLVLSAAGLWGSSYLTWSTSIGTVPGTGAATSADVPVSAALPSVVPLAVLALAGVAGVLALGPVPRRVAGALLAAAGLVPVWQAVAGTGGAVPARLAVAVAGLVMAAAGGVLLIRGARLPRMGARYAAPGAAKESARTDDDLWQALSEGEDPTAGR